MTGAGLLWTVLLGFAVVASALELAAFLRSSAAPRLLRERPRGAGVRLAREIDDVPVTVVTPLVASACGTYDQASADEAFDRLAACERSELEIVLLVQGDTAPWHELLSSDRVLRVLTRPHEDGVTLERYRLRRDPRLHLLFVGSLPLERAIDGAIREAHFPLVCVLGPNRLLVEGALVRLVRALRRHPRSLAALGPPAVRLDGKLPSWGDLRQRLARVLWAWPVAHGRPAGLWKGPLLVRRDDVVRWGGLDTDAPEDTFDGVLDTLGRALAQNAASDAAPVVLAPRAHNVSVGDEIESAVMISGGPAKARRGVQRFCAAAVPARHLVVGSALLAAGLGVMAPTWALLAAVWGWGVPACLGVLAALPGHGGSLPRLGMASRLPRALLAAALAGGFASRFVPTVRDRERSAA